MADRLAEGEKLQRGESLTSNNGAYTLTLQDDGNLVLSAGGDCGVGDGHQRPERRTRSKCRRTATPFSTRRTSRSGTPTPRAPRMFGWCCRTTATSCCTESDGVAWASGTNTDEAPPAPPAQEARGRSRGGRGDVAARRGSGTAAPPPPPPPPPAPRTYTVVSGDTLWAISERFYGDGSKYQQIADASGVSNPDLIHPGQVLTIP